MGARRTAACLARLALLGLASLALGDGSSAEPCREGWPDLAQVGAALSDPAPEEGLARLAQLGPAASPALWAVLSGQALGELDLDRTAARALARRALAGWPDAAVVEELLAELRPETELDLRLEMLELLSWTGSRAGLAATFAVLRGLDPLQLHSSRVTSALGAALETVLLADERGFTALADQLADLEPALLSTVVETVGGLRPSGALLVLAELASLAPALEPDVLAALGAHPRRPTTDATWRCVDLARRALTSLDPRRRRLAAVALGRLRDGDSFFELLACLEDRDRVARRCALEALQELSGLRRAWSAEQWTSWWEAEQTWLEASDVLADVLAHGDSHRAAEAVREVARHRLLAGSAAALLAEGLRHREPRIRVLACGSLAQLGHGDAVPALVEAVEDRDEAVREAAREALETLTGLDRGPDPLAWHDWRATGRD